VEPKTVLKNGAWKTIFPFRRPLFLFREPFKKGSYGLRKEGNLEKNFILLLPQFSTNQPLIHLD